MVGFKYVLKKGVFSFFLLIFNEGEILGIKST